MPKRVLITLLICLLWPAICLAIPPMPARIGGTVSINGHQLLQAEAANYSFKATRSNGSPLKPEPQKTGLNNFNWYLIDIPIYNATDQPGGANPGDKLKIQVFDNGKELNIISPSNAEIKCGESGSTTQINLELQQENSLKNAAPQPE